jgi:hypothetical protein
MISQRKREGERAATARAREKPDQHNKQLRNSNDGNKEDFVMPKVQNSDNTGKCHALHCQGLSYSKQLTYSMTHVSQMA